MLLFMNTLIFLDMHDYNFTNYNNEFNIDSVLFINKYLIYW